MAITEIRGTAANGSGFYKQEIDDGIIPMVTQATYNRTLLSRALPLLLHMKLVMPYNMRKLING